MVSCAKKTAEPIEMPFWLKTRVDHSMEVQIPQGSFRGCSGHSKALAIFAAALLRRSLQKVSFNRQ